MATNSNINTPSEEGLDDGEWVTRSDGSKVLKVRKRKRRTNQQKYEVNEAGGKKLYFYAGGCVLLFVVCAAVGLIALKRVNSSSFLTKLEKNLSETSGAEVKIENLSISPLRASATKVHYQWESDHIISSLELQNGNFPHRGLGVIGAPWVGDSIEFTKGEMSLNPNGAFDLGGDLSKSFSHKISSFSVADLKIKIHDKELLKGGGVGYTEPNKISLYAGELTFIKDIKYFVNNGFVVFNKEKAELTLNITPESSDSSRKIEYRGDYHYANHRFDLSFISNGFKLGDLIGKTHGMIDKALMRTDSAAFEIEGTLVKSLKIDVDDVENYALPLPELYEDVAAMMHRDSDYASEVDAFQFIFEWKDGGYTLSDIKLRLNAGYEIVGKLDVGEDLSVLGSIDIIIGTEYDNVLASTGSLEHNI